MKKLYFAVVLILVFWSTINSTYAQKKIYLGKIKDVAATYRNRAKSAINNSKASGSQVSHALPGKQPLKLKLNFNEQQGNAEFFYGTVYNTPSSSFYLQITDQAVSGAITMLDQKAFYRYTSTPDGSVYLLEEDIDQVLCVGLPEVKQPTAPKSPGSNLSQSSAKALSPAAVPVLESLPGAGAVVYLDFDGQTITNTNWNQSYTNGKPIVAAPSTLTETEIIEVWKLMSEDFRPFALNVTTNEIVFNNAPPNRRIRVLFTPTESWYPKSVGGTAYVGSFTWGGITYNEAPCWVFNTTSKYAGEAGSHEVGHTLNLRHDGRNSPPEEYFKGQSFWAPIMGASYYVPLTQWSKGEYSNANNLEDDLTKITANGFGYRPDDHGNEINTATPLVKDVNGTVLAAANKGIISTQTDVDVFTFTHHGGPIALTVNPAPDFPDLDIYLSLRNSAGIEVATVNPGTLSATLDTTLAAGTYYLAIDGTTGALGANSDYATLGSYSISNKDYNLPVYTDGCATNAIFINNFSFHTLVNNNSACSSGTAKGYTSYDPVGTLTTTVNRGQNYSLTMQAAADYAEYFGVWIDYNNDKDFDDAGEFVYASPADGANLFSATITIPATATLGSTRMRVRSKYSGPVFTNYESSASFEYGEAEDYTITIKDPEVVRTEWNLRYGGKSNEGFTTVIKTADGGYLSGGYSPSSIGGDKTQSSQGKNDFWIVKSDKLGKKLWDKRYGGSEDDFLNALIQTLDGGYILAGSSMSSRSGDKTQTSRGGRDYWVVKISNTGVKQWDKRFGGSGADELKKIIPLASGHFILAGTSNSPANGDKSQAARGGQDYWLIKISSTGTKVWDKRYGGSADENLEGLALTLDGGFLLGGSSPSGVSGDKTQASRGNSDYWLVRVNSAGAKVWDKRFGGTGEDNLMDVGSTGTSTGNFFLAGHSTSGANGDRSQSSQGGKDFWMLKINGNGEKLFDKRFGGTGDEGLRTILLTADGGYLLAGRSESGVSGDKSQGNQGSSDYWIVKTSSTGVQQWDKRFGGSGYDEIRTAAQTTDGGFILGGRSESGVSGDRTQPSQGGSDYWLVKVAPQTILLAARKEVSEGEEATIKSEPLQLLAYPNPFSNKVTINFTLSQTQSAQVKVYDSQGREVGNLFYEEAKAKQRYQVEWQAGTKAAGVYLLQLQTPTLRRQQKLLLTK
ncbi:hypothetical protein AHMF7605_17475 [Adhaeribacter arboris]|uniref:Uncharacterized protein n=1 Tax=Adhaeribacter arboris TaxID=2072846 RepID=A0A2T2YI52_9BACT|nr:GEVED domain-containing protein [Adhaeribacter arboris]PSR55170.1 hypothetical protein AHMF7605_17475 [Adhaeribacter arboris]